MRRLGEKYELKKTVKRYNPKLNQQFHDMCREGLTKKKITFIRVNALKTKHADHPVCEQYKLGSELITIGRKVASGTYGQISNGEFGTYVPRPRSEIKNTKWIRANGRLNKDEPQKVYSRKIVVKTSLEAFGNSYEDDLCELKTHIILFCTARKFLYEYMRERNMINGCAAHRFAKIPIIYFAGQSKLKRMIGMERVDCDVGSQNLSLCTFISILRQVANTLAFLQSTIGFVHADLHPGNVMVKWNSQSGGKKSANATAYIIDFGMSIHSDAVTTRACKPNAAALDLLVFLTDYCESRIGSRKRNDIRSCYWCFYFIGTFWRELRELYSALSKTNNVPCDLTIHDIIRQTPRELRRVSRKSTNNLAPFIKYAFNEAKIKHSFHMLTYDAEIYFQYKPTLPLSVMEVIDEGFTSRCVEKGRLEFEKQESEMHPRKMTDLFCRPKASRAVRNRRRR